MTVRDGEVAVAAPGKAGAVLPGGQARHAVIRLPGEIDTSNYRQIRDRGPRPGGRAHDHRGRRQDDYGNSAVSVLFGAQHQVAEADGNCAVASPALVRITLFGADGVLDYRAMTAAFAGRRISCSPGLGPVRSAE